MTKACLTLSDLISPRSRISTISLPAYQHICVTLAPIIILKSGCHMTYNLSVLLMSTYVQCKCYMNTLIPICVESLKTKKICKKTCFTESLLFLSMRGLTQTCIETTVLGPGRTFWWTGFVQ